MNPQGLPVTQNLLLLKASVAFTSPPQDENDFSRCGILLVGPKQAMPVSIALDWTGALNVFACIEGAIDPPGIYMNIVTEQGTFRTGWVPESAMFYKIIPIEARRCTIELFMLFDGRGLILKNLALKLVPGIATDKSVWTMLKYSVKPFVPIGVEFREVDDAEPWPMAS